MIAESTLPAVDAIAEIVKGSAESRSSRPVTDVQVDSRMCSRDSLFVALPGERTDGHLFLEDAFRRGSSLSFVSRSFARKHRADIRRYARDYAVSIISVDHTLVALQSLAAAHMRRFDGVTVVAITGSNGKTTTKELLGAMLSAWRPTAVSPGNYNSDVGLPLACFGVRAEHRFAVFEMGTNRPGEIAELASIVRPRVAAVTNIGAAHVGLLGSCEAIAREKRDVFSYVCPGGRGFVGEEESYRSILIEGRERCIDLFGPRSTPGVRGCEDLGLRGTRIVVEGESVVFPLPGAHNLLNALCAVSMARYLGVPAKDIRGALSSARAGFARSEVLECRATILLDCYNANRHSMLRAIDTVDSISWTGRKILILGSMKELGDRSDAEHRIVARAAAASTVDRVFFFGEETAVARSAFGPGSPAATYHERFDELADAVSGFVRDGDFVLIKGSRSLEMERLLAVIDPECARGSSSC